MRGHEHLIALRRRGVRPMMAAVDMDEMPWRDWADWPDWTTTPQISVGADESIRRLDLRCFVGLPVLLSGSDEARTREMLAALLAAGSPRVIAFCGRVGIDSMGIEVDYG